MHPFNKPIHDLQLTDIRALVDNGIPESRTLDYKRDLYGTNDDGKKEFLCDASAFANTVGGYLIIGVDEDKGVPEATAPVAIDNVDKLKLLFENLLRTAVDPPMRGVDFQPIDAGGGKYVFVIEIPRSISRPHAVKHKGHWRFYGRNSSERYPYEVDDVRKAILQSETLAVRIRNFRNDRLAQINVRETPMSLYGGAKIVLHLICVSSFELGQRFDVGSLPFGELLPIYASGYSHRLNFDGVVTYDEHDRETGTSFNYTQMFSNGIIEAVDGLLLQEREENQRLIPSQAYEYKLTMALRRYLAALAKVGVDVPIWVCLSLLGVKDYFMDTGPGGWSRIAHPIDLDELILPEIQVEDASTPAERILRPAFDSIWNACGYERSMNYDQKGNWLLKGR